MLGIPEQCNKAGFKEKRTPSTVLRQGTLR